MIRKEQRYLIIKMTDAEKYLDLEDAVTLSGIVSLINNGRKRDGKDLVKAVVVESDWPMYESTWNAVLHYAEEQEAKKQCMHTWVEVSAVKGTFMCTKCHQCKVI